MVPIKQNLCLQSNWKNKCPYTMTPTRIVIHNTANDAPAENEVKYMIGNTN
jgi:N-acetylmuramoyl-L-alanine amidase CwlA